MQSSYCAPSAKQMVGAIVLRLGCAAEDIMGMDSYRVPIGEGKEGRWHGERDSERGDRGKKDSIERGVSEAGAWGRKDG